MTFFEALTAVQNAQSNGLVAALMILTLLATERRQPLLGATWIAIGASVKLFPIGAGVFGLLDRRRWTHLASCAAIGVALLALPLLITSPASLAAQYRSWLVVENADRTQPGMMWIGGALEWARGAPVPHAPIQLVGLTWMLFATYRCMSQWSDATVRRLFLASTLVFATIFNHQAESPSYVIAFTGIGIWWSVLRRARWRDAVMVGAFVFGSVSGTDIAPGTWRQIYLFTWQLKAIVATVVWCAIQYDLWRAITPSRRSPNESAMRPAVPESAHS